MYGAVVSGWSDSEKPVNGYAMGVLLALNVAANLAIVFGYLLVPFTVLRYLPLTLSVRIAGGLFFFTCAMTHLAMAFGYEHAAWVVVNHVVQAAAVMWFVLGFWLLLRAAVRRAEAKRRGQ